MDPSRVDAVVDRMARGAEALGSRLPRILADVRAYPREAMLLALILALAMILSLVVLFVLTESLAVARRRPRAKARGSLRTRALHVLTAVAVAGVLACAAALAPLAPSVSSWCTRSCHDLQPATAAWRSGSHPGVTCYGCHARPGPFGAIEAGLHGIPRLASAEETSRPGLTGTDSRACLRCHARIEREIVGRHVRMRHSDVLDDGYACTTCHDDVGHEGLAGVVSSAASSQMGECLVCHDGERAAADCGVCHVTRPEDRTGKPAGGTALSVTCTGCHGVETERRCIACHGLQLPHPATFAGQHARLSSRGPSLCAKCHESARPAAACACHPEENVHGTYTSWFPQHGPMAAKNGPGGCRCHDDGFCGLCHAGSPYPRR